MQMGMNSNKAEDVLAGSTPVFWAACLVWTAVFFAAAALWLRARGRGGIKRGGFFRLLAGFLAADAV